MKRSLFGSLALVFGFIASADAALISEWLFNGNLNDSVGGRNGTANNTLTYSNNIPSLGVHGPQSLDTGSGSTSATSGFMSYAPSAADTVSGSYTVAMWVNADSLGPGTFIGTRTGSDQSFDAKLQGGGTTVHGDIGTGGAWLTTSADAPFAFAAGEWHYVAYSVTPTGYSIYRDGALAGSGTYSAATPLLWDSTHMLGIGASSASGSEQFHGLINDVQIYNTALTAAQVHELFILPEPSSMILCGLGTVGLIIAARRRRQA